MNKILVLILVYFSITSAQAQTSKKAAEKSLKNNTAITKDGLPESTFTQDYLKSQKKIVVIISQQRLYAVENSKVRYAFIASTAFTGHNVFGSSHPPGLPKGDIHNHIGEFKIEEKTVYHFSSTWQSPMYYTLWYIKKLGVAIHGTDKIETLGLPSSHGCVRLHPQDALTLFLWADIGTPVIVKENNPPR